MSRPTRFTAVLGAALVSLLLATPALAHPGHDATGSGLLAGLLTGLAHPLLGLDHLVAMLAVGVWARQLGGRAQWQLPLGFVALMVLGALAARSGYAPPAIEAGIAASLIVFGLASARMLRLAPAAAAALVAAFAVFHGAAHGSELPATARPTAFIAGFGLATALLHAAGIAIAARLQRPAPGLLRAGGLASCGFGLVLACA